MTHTDSPHLAILTQTTDNPSVTLLKAAMEKSGAKVDLISYDNPKLQTDKEKAQAYHVETVRGRTRLVKNGRPLDLNQYDGVMLRCWGSETEGHAALQVFAEAGVPMANDHQDILAADSKVTTFRRFTEAEIPVPKTHVLQADENIENELSQFTEFPVVIKRDIGCRGNDVYFARDKNDAVSHIQSLRNEGETEIVLQQFICTGEKQKTYRCLVIQGKIVATIELTAPEGKLVTNSAQGGSGQLIAHPPREVTDIALRAAKTMNLLITGVDIITGEDGRHYALEANDSPLISAFPEKYGVPADSYAADAFIEKVNAQKRDRANAR
jgi:ribosomal protein S6--L-glutamate ligase